MRAKILPRNWRRNLPMPEQSPEAQTRPKSKARLVERPLSRRWRRRPYWRKRKSMLSIPPNKTSPVKVQFQFNPFVFILVVRRVVGTLSSWQRGHHVGGFDFSRVLMIYFVWIITSCFPHVTGNVNISCLLLFKICDENLFCEKTLLTVDFRLFFINRGQTSYSCCWSHRSPLRRRSFRYQSTTRYVFI